MPKRQKYPRKPVIVAAVSGGPDSVYLLRRLSMKKETRIVVGHVNYGTRGNDSFKDQVLVEKIAKSYGYDKNILALPAGSVGRAVKTASGTRRNFPSGFEEKARNIRYRFLRELSIKVGAETIALAHTADDQVETILMRVFEGAGIGGLKGIPRETADGIVRPILDVWKEDILDDLKKRKIPYRIDRSNADVRFERNWVRAVLLPLLVKRYGKAVKNRIFTLGERFREVDDYLEGEATRWIRRNLKALPGRANESRRALSFQRRRFSVLPSVLRVKILQRICFDRLGVAPNERLLKAMDGNVCDGGPSARVNAGKGWRLANRYGEALFVPEDKGGDRGSAEGSGSGKGKPVPIAAPGEYEIPLGRQGRIVTLAWESRGKGTAAQAKRLAAKGGVVLFDAAGLALPLTVRPLRAGDRIRLFGRDAGVDARGGGKKVKELLIDRKVPREERWGRPVLCDANGAILWIPGVLRSAHAPVTPETRKTAFLRIRSTK